MATRAPFLTTRFGGYYHRDVPQEIPELTHTGPGTPCGEYLRRFWQPICFADDLRDLPLRVRIMGEDLVVFRDFRGALGAPGAALSAPRHLAGVRADLANEGFAAAITAGSSMWTGPSSTLRASRRTSTLKDRLCHGAYPTHEYQGIVFGYMGPPEGAAPVPSLR